MMNRFSWSCWHRENPDAAWTWIASGCTFGEANAAGLLKAGTGEVAVLFGGQLPEGRISLDYHRGQRR